MEIDFQLQELPRADRGRRARRSAPCWSGWSGPDSWSMLGRPAHRAGHRAADGLPAVTSRCVGSSETSKSVKLTVLGCHGGELPGLPHHLLPRGRGARARRGRALRALADLDALAQVDHIILTHSHFDHVKDLPLLADLVVGRRETAGHGLGEPRVRRRRCGRTCSTTRSGRTSPASRRRRAAGARAAEPSGPGRRSRPAAYTVPVGAGEPPGGVVRVRHPTGRLGAGDQRRHRPHRPAVGAAQPDRPTSRRCCSRPASPTSCRTLADISGHLTPRTLRTELAKFERNGASVLLYHLKPAFVAELKQELAGLPVRGAGAGRQLSCRSDRRSRPGPLRLGPRWPGSPRSRASPPSTPRTSTALRQQPSRMQGLWAKCDACNEIIYRQEIEKNLERLPALRPPHAVARAGAAARRCSTRARFEELDARARAAGPARLLRHQEVPRPPAVDPPGAGRERRLRLRHGRASRATRCRSASSSSSSWAARWARWWARR